MIFVRSGTYLARLRDKPTIKGASPVRGSIGEAHREELRRRLSTSAARHCPEHAMMDPFRLRFAHTEPASIAGIV